VGSLRKRGDVWWTGTTETAADMKRARRLIRSAQQKTCCVSARATSGDVAKGLPVSAKVGQLRFDDAAADIINDYQVNGKRSLGVLRRRVDKHLRPWFGGRRMASVTTTDIRAYIAKRQADVIVTRRARHDGHLMANGSSEPQRHGPYRMRKSIAS
jgi:hypothetical protein